MADVQFFHNTGPKTLADLSALTGADIAIPGGVSISEDSALTDVAPLGSAGASDVSFLDNRKYVDHFKVTEAGACFVSPDFVHFAPKHLVCLVTKAPYKAYALAAQAFYPQGNQNGDEVRIDDGAIVKAGAKIGKGSWIESGAVIGENVVIGDHSRIGANAVVSHSIIGNYVRIYPGAAIGQDGFGFAIDPAGFVKVPQLGRVIIHDHVEVGANTTIDRGAGPDTVIGAGTWIDNLVQVGHNVQVGRGCVIVSQAGISGSTVVEDYVMIGGQSGVAGHLRVGKGAKIAGKSGIMRDVPAGEQYMGYPAVPMTQYMRQVAVLGKLAKPKKSTKNNKG